MLEQDSIVKRIARKIKRCIGIRPEYSFIPVKRYLQYFLFQRVLRINSHVPWPVHWSSVVSSPQNIKFKREITPLGYSPSSYIQATNGIEVGSNVIHGPGISIISSNHLVDDFLSYSVDPPVKIGDNCWLGAGCVILPGVVLGEHTVVAAGAVVTRSFPDGNCIVAGVPAKIVKSIPPYRGKHYFLRTDRS